MMGFAGLIRIAGAIFISLILQQGMLTAVDEKPYDAAAEFMDGISRQQEETLNMYMSNDYVNFLANVEGDAKATDRLRKNLLKNFSYKMGRMEERDNLAVVKIRIKANDFSKAMEEYEEESYTFVTENLYEDFVTDEKELKARCLDIYVDRIEEEAREGKVKEDTIYLPLAEDEHGNWRVILDDKIMRKILGNIALPGNVIPKEKIQEKKE